MAFNRFFMLIDIVKDLENKSDEERRDVVRSYLDYWSIDYNIHDYSYAGKNIVVDSDKEKEIGILSHFDAVPGSPGANDNASAVAVSLDILRKSIENPLTNLGIRGLIFDQEENGLAGSQAYVREYGVKSLIGVYNMEMVGSGNRLALWSDRQIYEGLLLKTFETQAKEKGIKTHRFSDIVQILRNSGDHLSFIQGGLKESFCITAISDNDIEIAKKYLIGFRMNNVTDVFSQSDLFRHYHSETDKSDYLSEKTMQDVSDLLWESCKQIDASLNDR